MEPSSHSPRTILICLWPYLHLRSLSGVILPAGEMRQGLGIRTAVVEMANAVGRGCPLESNDS